MNKLAFVGSAVGVSLTALLGLHLSQAADHLDSTTLAGNPMADINDVYAWMTSDGAKINLALTVSPHDDGSHAFDPSTVYVFHVTSKGGFPLHAPCPDGTCPSGFACSPAMTCEPTQVESKVICKFASNTSGACWVVNANDQVADYVTGDFSTPDGVSSAGGKLKVFAGPRSDPFFFNFGGFVSAVTVALGATYCAGDCPGGLGSDAAKCPTSTDFTKATTLRTLVSTAPASMVGFCPAGQIDCFSNLNVMSIVIQLDKGLVLSGSDALVSVWAATHAGS